MLSPRTCSEFNDPAIPFRSLLTFDGSYSQTRLQVVRYIADRTGILSIANVAIAWVFAARNDPLLWVTGWSFALFNRFHRAAARIATVQAIVHSICYSLFDFYYGGASNYYLDWSVRYWYCGQIVSDSFASSRILNSSLTGDNRYGVHASGVDVPYAKALLRPLSCPSYRIGHCRSSDLVLVSAVYSLDLASS